MALVQKSIHIEEEIQEGIETLLADSTVQKKLACFRKNAGENQLIRLILKNGLPITKRQLLGTN